MSTISKTVKRNILLNPGPPTTTDRVKAAQIVPDICPREKEFGRLVESIRKDLTKIAGGDDRHTTIPFCCSGTGVMEAVLTSVIPPGRSALILDNGAYGRRFAKIAEAHSIPHEVLTWPWGELPDLGQIRQAVRSNRDISHLFVIHHETTTGLLNPIRDICAIAKEFSVETVVDAMSTYAGVPLNVIEDKIDYCIASSNKNIEAMAGISFVICSLAALRKTETFSPRNFYFNLTYQYNHIEKTGQFAFTPPVQILYALREAIDQLFDEGGLEARHKRYCENWKVLTDGLKQMGFKLLLPDEQQSKILTAIFEPKDPNYNFDRMHDLLYERGFTIYPGKGAAKGNTFRLANMGSVTPDDMRAFLAALREVLAEMGIKNLKP